MPNPFLYGAPVDGEHFTGRQAELRSILSRVRTGVNVVLMSPRRYGKTSLLKRAATRLIDADGAAVARLNVMNAPDLPSFAAQLVGQVYGAKGGAWQRLKAVPDFLKRVRVTPTVTFGSDDRPRFGFQPGFSVADAHTVITDMYAVLAELAEHRPAVLILDEFQAVLDVDKNLPALFKALADEHPSVALVLAGSNEHMMRRLFQERTGPLYGMAEHYALGRIPDDEMADFLVRRASAGGKTMPREVADAIVAAAGPVPNDIQRLAFEVYDCSTKKIVALDVAAGMNLVVQHESARYAQQYEDLSPGQRRVVHRLAHEPSTAPQSTEFVHAVGLANPSSVRKAITALRASEVVVYRSGGTPASEGVAGGGQKYAVTDPFFAEWLRNPPGL